MEKRDFDDFFESYLDIDSWADELIDKEHEVQGRRKKRLSEKKQQGKMGVVKNNNKPIARQNNGKTI